jgi:hypothetical protein
MQNEIKPVCPECAEAPTGTDGITRRALLQAAGGAVVAATAGVVASSFPAYATPRVAQTAKAALTGTPESLVKTLYYTLSEDQKRAVCLPWDNLKRKMVNANWAIVDPTIGKTFNGDQQDILRAILKGVTNEEWYGKFLAQMKNDGGGFENYHVALFGDPDSGKSELVMTGRHMTLRAGGDPAENMAFGGPIFYGHAPKDTEDPTHPGNLFWYQAKRANEAFQMLDGKQRDQALIALAPDESAVDFRKPGQPLPGVPVGSLSRDQKEHIQKVIRDVLAPYRKKDVDEVMRDVKESGGLDALHLAFFKQDDLGNDGVWDIWRLEGPAFVWHFRGAPHVHTWVNIGRKA